MKNVKTAVLALVILSLSACSTAPLGPGGFGRKEAATTYDVKYGTVVSVAKTSLKGDGSVGSAAVGAGLGAAAMSSVGGGKGRGAAALFGALVGGLVGSGVEAFSKTDDHADRITFRADSSSSDQMVVQPSSKHEFHAGERVQIIKTPEGDRVLPTAS